MTSRMLIIDLKKNNNVVSKNCIGGMGAFEAFIPFIFFSFSVALEFFWNENCQQRKLKRALENPKALWNVTFFSSKTGVIGVASTPNQLIPSWQPIIFHFIIFFPLDLLLFLKRGKVFNLTLYDVKWFSESRFLWKFYEDD